MQVGVANKKTFSHFFRTVSTKDSAACEENKQKEESWERPFYWVWLLEKNGCSLVKIPVRHFSLLLWRKGNLFRFLWGVGACIVHWRNTQAPPSCAFIILLFHPPNSSPRPTDRTSQQASERPAPCQSARRAQSCQVTMMMMMIQLHNMLLAAKSRAQEAAWLSGGGVMVRTLSPNHSARALIGVCKRTIAFKALNHDFILWLLLLQSIRTHTQTSSTIILQHAWHIY